MDKSLEDWMRAVFIECCEKEVTRHERKKMSTFSEDAVRYAFAKTIEGQVVTIKTFRLDGAAALDQALDDARQ